MSMRMSVRRPSDAADRSARTLRGLALLGASVAVLLLPLWWLPETYRGSSDLHVAMEVVGGAVGLIGGIAFMARYVALGDGRMFLIALAFLGNGATSVVHGWLPFAISRGWLDAGESVLTRVVPATYVAGQLMMAVLLAAAATGRSADRGGSVRTAVTASVVTMAAAVVTTVVLFSLPVPTITSAMWSIPRPLDLVVVVPAAVAVVALWVAAGTGDPAARWAAVSAILLTSAQLAMTSSRALYDAAFDLAHVYKIAAFGVPLLALSVNQVWVLAAEQRHRRELALIVRVRSEFVAAVSHRLRTPLALIDGHAALAGDEAGEETRAHLGVIRDQVVELNGHVADLIALSAPVPISTGGTTDVGRLLVAALGERVVTRARPDELQVAAPEGDVRQILRHLLTLASDVRIEVWRADGSVIVRLPSDRPPVEIDDPALLDDTATGHSLAVAIAARLAADHGGAIWYEPDAGGGSGLLLRLPAAV